MKEKMQMGEKKYVGLTVTAAIFTAIFFVLVIVGGIVSMKWTLNIPTEGAAPEEAIGAATGALLAGMLFVLLKFFIIAAGLGGFFWSLGGLRITKTIARSYSPKVRSFGSALRVCNFALLVFSIALIVINVVQLAIL